MAQRLETDSLVVGKTYYLVSFADKDMTMPCIEPKVYLGMDAFGPHPDAEPSQLYFQDTISLVRFGYATDDNPPAKYERDGEKGEEEPEYWVESFAVHEIGEAIVDLHGAMEVLRQAELRASQLGHPRLQRARGTWHRLPTE